MMNTEATTIDMAHDDVIGREAVAIQTSGFWIYLMSDLVLFATLFATFIVLRHGYAGGPEGRELFDLKYTLGETMFLLTSSVACGLAMLAAQQGKKKLVLIAFTVTFLLGLGFVLMEINEFYGLVAAGHGPATSGFLSGFFTLVGTHGTHVTVGLIWMAIMIGQVAVKGLTSPVQSRLTRLSMFWHFLDIVWIAVFSIVYLMGVVS
jgi:cytochrome o ubiquinol oxidase subunit III